MTMNSFPGDGQARPTRSAFVTALGWAVIGVSAMLSVISMISLLMIMAKSYGTASVTAAGFFTTVVMPPVSLVAGIGLLRRKAWARHTVLVLLGILIVIQGASLLNRRPETTVTTSPSGVRTTVMASEPNNYSLPLMIVCALLMLKLGSRALRPEFGIPGKLRDPQAGGASAESFGRKQATASGPEPDKTRDWRVRHQGRDNIYYEESHGLEWKGITIEGEMLTGPAHHVIYFASTAHWAAYPEWARQRRDEIIRRIKSEFRPPDYEYQEVRLSASTPTSVPASAAVSAAAFAQPPAPAAQRTVALSVTPAQRRALFLAIVLMLGIASGMGWLVKSGLDTDTTWFPAKRASQQRAVAKAEEPALFWFAISLYSILGLGSAGAAAWLIRQGKNK